MGPHAQRRTASLIVLVLAAFVWAPVTVVRAQSDEVSMCLLTLDEVREATGLPFTTSADARGACTYATDPAVDMLALDLRIDRDAGLDSVRFAFERGGRDTTVADLPTWSSQDGLFVEIGGHLLVVQPVLFLSDTPADPVTVQEAVAELAVPRVGAAMDAAFGGEDRLTALFPTQVAGEPLYVSVMNGQDFLTFVDLGTAGIEAVLADAGLTLADLSVGTASGAGGDIAAFHAPGIDASLLLPAVSEGVTRFGGGTATPTERDGRALISFPTAGIWLYASGDVLWMITQPDEAALDTILAALP
jgi:hypothetical protein